METKSASITLARGPHNGLLAVSSGASGKYPVNSDVAAYADHKQENGEQERGPNRIRAADLVG